MRPTHLDLVDDHGRQLTTRSSAADTTRVAHDLTAQARHDTAIPVVHIEADTADGRRQRMLCLD